MEEFFARKDGYFRILAVLSAIVALLLGIYSYTAKRITIAIDDEVRSLITHADTVGKLLQLKNINLDKNGYIDVPLDAKLEKDMNINIATPKPYVLAIGNLKMDVQSPYTRVQDILQDLDVQLDGRDYTEPSLHKEVASKSEIAIIRVKEEFEELEEIIPHSNIIKRNNRLDIGTENIIQEGEDGLKNIRIKNIYENGKLVSEDIIAEEVIVEPTPHIVERGTKDIIASSRGEVRYRNTITMTATAYDLSYASTGKNPGDRYYGITASGTKAKPGVVAVDPRIIPLGTRLYVESLDNTEDYGFCIAEDTGGAIKGNRIDLFFNTAGEVKRFGRRKVKVYVLE